VPHRLKIKLHKILSATIAGLPWIWISMDISMDITLAQHYNIKPMQNSSKLQSTY